MVPGYCGCCGRPKEMCRREQADRLSLERHRRSLWAPAPAQAPVEVTPERERAVTNILQVVNRQLLDGSLHQELVVPRMVQMWLERFTEEHAFIQNLLDEMKPTPEMLQEG